MSDSHNNRAFGPFRTGPVHATDLPAGDKPVIDGPFWPAKATGLSVTRKAEAGL